MWDKNDIADLGESTCQESKTAAQKPPVALPLLSDPKSGRDELWNTTNDDNNEGFLKLEKKLP